MASNEEIVNLLKSFQSYMVDQRKFLTDYIANQDINFPPEVRGGEGGQAKTAKLPIDWQKKLDPISGGELGDRKEYGTGDKGRSTSQAKTGDPYLHKHAPGEGHAYDEGQSEQPYTEPEVEGEGYPIEKTPVSYDQNAKDMEEDMEEEDEDEEEGEEEEKEEDTEEMKSILKSIKKLVKQNASIKNSIMKQIDIKKQAIAKKQYNESFSKAVELQVASVLEKMGITASNVTSPAPVIAVKSEDKAPVLVSKSEVPGVPDTDSFNNIRLADMMGKPLEDIKDFNEQVRKLAGVADPLNFKDDFTKLNKMREMTSGKNVGSMNYLNPDEYSKLQMKRTNSKRSA